MGCFKSHHSGDGPMMKFWTQIFLICTFLCLSVNCQTTPYPPGTMIQCNPDGGSNWDDNRDDPYIITEGETFDITSHTDYDGSTKYNEPGNTYNCLNRICVSKIEYFSAVLLNKLSDGSN